MLSTPNIKRGGGRCNQRNQPINLPEKIEKVRFTTFIAFDLHWYLKFDDILRHRCHATCHAQRKSLHFSLYIGCFADHTGCSVPLLLSGSIGNEIDKQLFPLWLSSDITSRSVRTQLLPEIWTSWWNRWRRSSYVHALPVFDSDTKYQIWIAIMILIFTIIRDHVKGNFRYLLSLFWDRGRWPLIGFMFYDFVCSSY